MEQLTYISTARRGTSESAVAEILAISKRRNTAAGLTGLLLFDGRRFLQVLEGESSALDATFARISADSRHFAIVQLARRSVMDRSFGLWSMTARDIRQGGRTISEEIAPLVLQADASTRAMFESFARIERAV